jgi:hypothetical protein
MLIFRNTNKFKLSDCNEFNVKIKHMKMNAYMCLVISGLIAATGAWFVMWNTFPDSIAVYNPFEKRIILRNLESIDSFLIFCCSFFIVLALVMNSMFFTVSNSRTMKAMHESSRVCFTLNLLQSDFWSCFATLFPMAVFFIVLYVNYVKANIYGITMEYLGIITFYQFIQFFQNFKCIYYFYLSLLMASKQNFQQDNENFKDVVESCRFFGKFSNGVALFITKILCFVILVDSFNIHIVDTIVIIDPYYILGIVTGCLGLHC